MNAFFFPRLHKVEALAPCNLRTWSTGEVLDVDVESALLSNPALCDILAPSVFALVHIGFGGCTIEWKDSKFDADNVYAWGKEQKGEASHQMFCDWMQRNNLSQDAAATALGISPRTVRRYATAQSSIPRRIWLACLGWEAIGGLSRGPLPLALPTQAGRQ